MIDSNLGLNPKDESPEAKAKRVLPGLKQLDGITFVARIMIEPSDNPRYRDQNRIAKRRHAGRAAIRGRDAGQARAARAGEGNAAEDWCVGERAAGLGLGAERPGAGARLVGRAHPAREGTELVVDAVRARSGTAPARRAGSERRARLAERLSMAPDAWQAFVTRQSAEEIARWLEGRGGLHRPIASLAMRDLEAMATAAISRFVVLASQRIAQAPEESDALSRLLLA